MTLTKKKKKRLRDKKSTVFFFVLQAQSVIVWYGGLELLKSNNPNDENQVFVIEFKSILWYSKTWLEKTDESEKYSVIVHLLVWWTKKKKKNPKDGNCFSKWILKMRYYFSCPISSKKKKKKE